MSVTLRCVMAIGVIIYFLAILYFLKKKSLALKYSLLWIVCGMIMGVVAIFPKILYQAVSLLGIQSPVNGLYAMCIFFIIIILMSLTSIVSKQTERIKNLTQYIAILEKKICKNERSISENRRSTDEKGRNHNISSIQ